MTTAAEILARRERAAVPLAVVPPEEGRHERVRSALGVILMEIDRLRALEKREDLRRAARAETAEVTALALRKAAHREAKRHLTVVIDKQFFQQLGLLALRAVPAAQYAELQEELEKIWQGEQRLSGSGAVQDGAPHA
jgi:hypothetical protein